MYHFAPVSPNDDTVRVDQKLLVAAIDIGTTYSGYAFSFAHEQTGNEADPDRIHVNTWENEGGSRTYFKTPSCLLLFPNGKLDCFGNEALEKYKTLEEDKKHRDFYFFREFKMTLHQEEVCLRKTKKTSCSNIRIILYSLEVHALLTSQAVGRSLVIRETCLEAMNFFHAQLN